MISKTLKTALFGALTVAMILPFSSRGMADGQTSPQDDYAQLKENITTKMQSNNELQVKKSKPVSTIPYNGLFVIDGEIIVSLDAEQADASNQRWTVDQIQNDLDTELDINLEYGVFVRESNPIFGGG